MTESDAQFADGLLTVSDDVDLTSLVSTTNTSSARPSSSNTVGRFSTKAGTVVHDANGMGHCCGSIQHCSVCSGILVGYQGWRRSTPSKASYSSCGILWRFLRRYVVDTTISEPGRHDVVCGKREGTQPIPTTLLTTIPSLSIGPNLPLPRQTRRGTQL